MFSAPPELQFSWEIRNLFPAIFFLRLYESRDTLLEKAPLGDAGGMLTLPAPSARSLGDVSPAQSEPNFDCHKILK